MTAADSTVITFSAPVFVVVVAWIFLREKCGFIPFLTALFVLVGVGIIVRPPWITGEKEFDRKLLVFILPISSLIS
jgi:drug/metabolite transporter (DMT)-like permease